MSIGAEYEVAGGSMQDAWRSGCLCAARKLPGKLAAGRSACRCSCPDVGKNHARYQRKSRARPSLRGAASQQNPCQNLRQRSCQTVGQTSCQQWFTPLGGSARTVPRIAGKKRGINKIQKETLINSCLVMGGFFRFVYSPEKPPQNQTGTK